MSRGHRGCPLGRHVPFTRALVREPGVWACACIWPCHSWARQAGRQLTGFILIQNNWTGELGRAPHFQWQSPHCLCAAKHRSCAPSGHIVEVMVWNWGVLYYNRFEQFECLALLLFDWAIYLISLTTVFQQCVVEKGIQKWACVWGAY